MREVTVGASVAPTTFWLASTRCLPTFPRTAIEDDRHLLVVGEGSLEVFVIVQGIARDDDGVAPVWWTVHCFRDHTGDSSRFSYVMGDK
jgi:hypothetical protein